METQIPSRITIEETKVGTPLSVEAQNLPGYLHTKIARNQYDGMDSRRFAHELPWHKHAAKYLAMGMSKKTTAELCDCSLESIGDLLRASWFMARVKELMDEGQDDVMALLKGAAEGAIVTLIEICEDSKAPKAARVTAAKEILDRRLGKSVTYIESKTQHVSNDPVEEVKLLEAEVRRLRSNGSGPLIQLNS